MARAQRNGSTTSMFSPLLRVSQELWAWTLHVLPTLTYAWAVLPHVDEATIETMEWLQQRAYLTQVIMGSRPR